MMSFGFWAETQEFCQKHVFIFHILTKEYGMICYMFPGDA